MKDTTKSYKRERELLSRRIQEIFGSVIRKRKEMIIKKFSSAIYSALGVYLPLITTNCAVLGVAIDSTVNSEKYSFFSATPTLAEVTVYAIGISLGYALVIFLFSAIREELDAYPIKRNWQGIPIALITAFIMAMIFIGFGGIV